MAVTQNTYTGDGSTVLFSFTFPYLETTDIKVSLNGTVTTAYTLANATTIQFNTAPANGAAIRIYRETDDSALTATFYPGSAIRSSDLNDNFTQNLYVTQESSNNAATANTTANTALTNSNTAISTANSAVSTANTASSNAAAAVATANTASSNASAAVSTANTASSNATAAVNTANAASATATSAASDAATALSTANSASSDASAAVATANTASSNASAAVSTANTASTNASNAVSTANSAVTTANNAVSTANSAVSTANSAVSTANAAASAVANAILFDIVANVAAIPSSPANNDAVEVTDATGIESFTPLTGVPAGFVGDAGLSVRIVYDSLATSWSWIQYFPNDPDDRYAGVNTNKGSAALPSISFGPDDIDTGIYSPGADQLALSTNGTGRLFVDASGNVGIGGTSSHRLSLTDVSKYTFNVSNSYTLLTSLNAAGSAFATSYYNALDHIWQTSGTERLRITSAGLVGIGTSSPSGPLGVQVDTLKDVTVGLTSGSPMITYRNGSGAWFHAGKHPTSDYFVISDGATTTTSERLVIDTAGRVGIGTTSPSVPLEVNGSIYSKIGTSGDAALAAVNSIASFFVLQQSDKVNLYTGAGQPIVFTNNNSERARIDSSGRLLVGTSSARTLAYGAIPTLQVESTNTNASFSITRNSNDLNGPNIFLGKTRSTTNGGAVLVQANDELGQIVFSGASGSGSLTARAANISCFVDGNPSSLAMPGRITFSTHSGAPFSNPVERMRIDATGSVRTFGATNTEALAVSTATVASTSVPLIIGRHTASSTGGGTNAFIVWSGGNVVNTNNSYGAISDIKLKENIVDASSQWDDIKALRPVNYNFKEGQTHTQLGLIAQEVELVSPGLVTESPDRDAEGNELGTVTKSVNYSVLYMKAVKALQEAMERIETLEAKVVALESA